MPTTIKLCNDGVTRAVEIKDGVIVDPSLEKEAEKKVIEKKRKPKISIQGRIQNQVENFVSEIEGQVDDFISSNYKLNFDVYKDLINRGCKSVHARKMRPFYVNCYNELVDVYNQDDEFSEEAWKHLKPKSRKKMMDFFGIIVDDLDRVIKNATAQRKPRKRKTFSAPRLMIPLSSNPIS